MYIIEPCDPPGWFRIVNTVTGACVANCKGYKIATAVCDVLARQIRLGESLVGCKCYIPRWIMNRRTRRGRVEGVIVQYDAATKQCRVSAEGYRGTRGCHVNWLNLST